METMGFFGIAALVALLALVGAVSGVIAGLLGVGGGIVIVPALYYVFLSLDFPQASIMHVAVATSLATIVFTSVRSVMAHNKRGAVDWAVLKGWAPWIVAGSVAGAWLADYFDTRALMAVFGGVAFIVALNLAFPSDKRVIGAEPPKGVAQAGIATGTGFFSALMGIGGGTLGVPILMLYSQPVRRAVATAAGFGVLIAAPAVIGFILIGLDVTEKPPFTLGYVNVVAFAILTPLTVLCAPIGVKLAHSINTRLLTLVFAFFLAATALNMLRKALYG